MLHFIVLLLLLKLNVSSAIYKRDTPRHSFSECASFSGDRLAVLTELGSFTPETCVTAMCESVEAVVRHVAVVTRRRNWRSEE